MMAGKIKNCKGIFYVYSIKEFDYVGVSTNLRPRMNKHKSKNKLSFTPTYDIVKCFTDYREALDFEENLQIKLGYPVRSQSRQFKGKNPASRFVVNTITGAKYNSIKEAAEVEDLNYGSLRQWIRNENYYLKRV